MAEDATAASQNRNDEETPLLAENGAGSASNVAPDGGEQTIIPESMSTKRLVLTLGSVYVGVFLGALDSTIVATLAAPISTSFNSLSLLSWIASAYLIANSACMQCSLYSFNMSQQYVCQ
jgi:hypothetical protein